MQIKSICVCGAGTMGTGIAQVAAQAGYDTILYELNPKVLERAKTQLDTTLQTLRQKGKITEEESNAITNRLKFTSTLDACHADLFIEAIIEDPSIKTALFNQLSELNEGDSIFATNTSSLSVSAIAGKVKHPERVIGVHFFNPAPVMKLVEVVRTTYNDDALIEKIISLVRSLGKTPVLCSDSPGFIVNRVARPYYIESLRLVEEGIADYHTIDSLLEASGFKLGPFKLMDLIGNDVNYAVSCSVYSQLSSPERLKPSHIQQEKVREGKLGKKSGEGYYRYG